MDVWRIAREAYEPENAADNGNRFLIGNGFLGVRGVLEEFRADKQAAVTLAGVYDRAQNQTWREPVNAPNGFFARLENAGNILKHSQSLNIRCGIHSRETLYERAALRIERFASMADVHVLCQRIAIEPFGEGEVTLICGIDADVWDINGPHLTDLRTDGGDVLRVRANTYEQRIPITVSEVCDVPHDEIRAEGNSIYRVFRINRLAALERVITINGEPRRGKYFDMRSAHVAVWERLWRNSAVTITGDDEAQLALNYSLYHLHSVAPRHADGLSIPARGLSGQTYKGAVFWDTEIFMLPFFTLTEPSLAARLMRYRVDSLPGARQKAAQYGYGGAFYAWESQEGGAEVCTDFNVVDVFTGRPVRTYFRDKQIHISGDVAYALCKYIHWSGDAALWDNGGRELVFACAEFFISRAFRRAHSDVLEFTDVLGPDEYHERVDNNAFTNRMAAFTLERAGYSYPVRAPRVRDGVVEQFDGYFGLEDAALSEVRGRLKHKNEYWGSQGGVAYSTQIIKQADVLAMMHLFPDDFTDADVERSWRYYEPRTEHGSSLSACMYALTACRFGRADLAYPLFLKSARADLDGGGKSFAGGVYIGGTHPAAAGGAYMIAAEGFAGLRQEGEALKARPCLPEQFEALEFPFVFRGRRKSVRVTREKAEIEERHD